jgi:hypothetical protein
MNLRKLLFDIFSTRERLTKIEVTFQLVCSDGSTIPHSATDVVVPNLKKYYYKDKSFSYDKYNMIHEFLKEEKVRSALHKQMQNIWMDLPEEIHLHNKNILIKNNLIGMRWEHTDSNCAPVRYEDMI